MGIFNSIVSFISGPLNDFAWMYTFLPFAILGGAFLTVRNGGIQFTRFGHAMKNTVGKIFQKQEAGEGAVTPRQAVTTALSATVGTATSWVPLRPSPWAATVRCSGCGWRPWWA
ncbi:hypothetical protein [uncultured Dysosmobacter sp.]|uniref:hypothetical protein n=1 Tax=uncultured Dysosmobacter sp. TaxID=2591384 RepID=UPI00260E9247|nr:hypothetical protein [uncultured Dysosmobacter sp.]